MFQDPTLNLKVPLSCLTLLPVATNLYLDLDPNLAHGLNPDLTMDPGLDPNPEPNPTLTLTRHMTLVYHRPLQPLLHKRRKIRCINR